MIGPTRWNILKPLSKEFKFPQYEGMDTSGKSVDPNYTIRLAFILKRHLVLGLNKTPSVVYMHLRREAGGLPPSTFGGVWEHEALLYPVLSVAITARVSENACD